MNRKLILRVFTFAEFEGKRPSGEVPDTNIVLSPPSPKNNPISPIRSEEERHILQTNLKLFYSSKTCSLSDLEKTIKYILSHNFKLVHRLYDRLIFSCNPSAPPVEPNDLKELKDGKESVTIDKRSREDVNMRFGKEWFGDGGWGPHSTVKDIDCLRCNERSLGYLPFSCSDRSLQHLGPQRFIRLAHILRPHFRNRLQDEYKYTTPCGKLLQATSHTIKSFSLSSCQNCRTLIS